MHVRFHETFYSRLKQLIKLSRCKFVSTYSVFSNQFYLHLQRFRWNRLGHGVRDIAWLLNSRPCNCHSKKFGALYYPIFRLAILTQALEWIISTEISVYRQLSCSGQFRVRDELSGREKHRDYGLAVFARGEEGRKWKRKRKRRKIKRLEGCWRRSKPS